MTSPTVLTPQEIRACRLSSMCRPQAGCWVSVGRRPTSLPGTTASLRRYSASEGNFVSRPLHCSRLSDLGCGTSGLLKCPPHTDRVVSAPRVA